MYKNILGVLVRMTEKFNLLPRIMLAICKKCTENEMEPNLHMHANVEERIAYL